jgi:hypothetical protein
MDEWHTVRKREKMWKRKKCDIRIVKKKRMFKSAETEGKQIVIDTYVAANCRKIKYSFQNRNIQFLKRYRSLLMLKNE